MVAPEHEPDGTDARPPTRANAAARRERILGAAAALAGDRRVSMIEIAAAAGVGRSTLYRHFPTRDALDRALTERPERAIASRDPPESRVATMRFRAPGQLGRERPLALEVTRVLDEVPPHLVPDQLVAEAPTTSRPRHRRRTTGVPRHQPAAPPRRAAHPHHRRRHRTPHPGRRHLRRRRRRQALQRTDTPTATAMAIQQTVSDCWTEPLEDDATIVVLAVE